MNFKKSLFTAFAAAALVSVATPAVAFFGGSTGGAKEITQLASWAAQYSQMITEYKQLVAEYNSLNGTRGMASLVNNPSLRRYLPNEYKSILSSGYGDSAALRAALDAPIGNNALYKLRRDQLAIDEAMSLEGYKQASRRFGDIQVLLDKINDSSNPDAKDMQDLQARIQAEQVMLQNESTKLAMLKNLQEIQKQKMQERAFANDRLMRRKPGVLGDMGTPEDIFK